MDEPREQNPIVLVSALNDSRMTTYIDTSQLLYLREQPPNDQGHFHVQLGFPGQELRLFLSSQDTNALLLAWRESRVSVSRVVIDVGVAEDRG